MSGEIFVFFLRIGNRRKGEEINVDCGSLVTKNKKYFRAGSLLDLGVFVYFLFSFYFDRLGSFERSFFCSLCGSEGYNG